jgi:hypothetical protein
VYGSLCYFDENARPESNRAAVLKPQTDSIVLSRPYVYDYVETREPPDQHAAFNLRRARVEYPTVLPCTGFRVFRVPASPGEFCGIRQATVRGATAL